MRRRCGRPTNAVARSERAIESKEEYILPARFDDTEIPGLRKTISYVDLRRKSSAELAALILQKLGRILPEAKELSAW